MPQKISDLSLLSRVKMKYRLSLKHILLTYYLTAIVAGQNLWTHLAQECGIINSDRYRNGLNTTDIDEFPWMARVAYNSTISGEITFRCQAVLITAKHVVSVAQCFRDNIEEAFAVVLGDWDTRNDISEKDCNVAGVCSQPLLIEIDEIIIHPYNNYLKRENDISLIRLTKYVTFTDFIRPICLPGVEVQTAEFGSEELMLTGWQRINTGHVKAKMPIVMFNIQDCRRKYQNSRVNITDSVLCGITCNDKKFYMAGAALMDIKQTVVRKQPTESQSPSRVHLVGIVSFGPQRCGNRIPDIMVRIDRYVDWITDNLHFFIEF